jgi:hypothetical protein
MNLMRQAQYWANGQATNYNGQLISIMSSMLPIGVWGRPNPYPLTSALLISESKHTSFRHTATAVGMSQPGMFVIISIHLLSHFVLGDVGPIISKRAACCLEFGVQYDPPIHYVGVASFHSFDLSPHMSLSLPLFYFSPFSSFLSLS